jgi:outer membrane protein OmpA-like peptidoglycan-associated protein
VETGNRAMVEKLPIRKNGPPPARFAFAPVGLLQRKCACGGSAGSEGACGDCKKKLQRRAVGTGPATAPPIVHEVLRSPGKPLDGQGRSFFEPRFGHDFSQVRVHADEKAAESARDVNALAYTVGHDLVFGKGLFAPATNSGRRLLAHELAHVVQQSANGGQHVLSSSLEIGPEGDFAESQAETVASSIVGMSGTLGSGQSSSTRWQAGIARLQRQSGGGTEDQSQKPVEPLIRWGDWGFDPKVITPLGGGSLEDAHKAYDALTDKEKPKDLSCPIGWVKMKEGGCCKGEAGATGSNVDLRTCCSPVQLTQTGMCCPPDQTAEKWGCKKNPPLAPQNPTLPPAKTSQAGPFQLQPPTSTPIRFGTIESEILDNFDPNSPRIPSGNEERLDHLASLLNIYREVEVHIEGHTDGSGTEAINKPLSRARAEAVKSQLIRRGVTNPGRLRTEGFSAAQPRVTAQNPTDLEPKNRRVEIWYHIPASGSGLGSKGTP